MNYTKTTPCDLCPFRNDAKRLTVSAERLLEMASGEFACHSGLIFNEKRGMPHQMMRICERLGMYDASKLDMDAPVFEDENEVEEVEENKFAKKSAR